MKMMQSPHRSGAGLVRAAGRAKPADKSETASKPARLALKRLVKPVRKRLVADQPGGGDA